MNYLMTLSGLKRSLKRSFFGSAGMVFLLLGCLEASAQTYPPTSSFYYGNCAVPPAKSTVPVSGSGYPLRYLEPPTIAPNTKYPVIIFLHGLGQNGTDDVSQIANGANGALALVQTANPPGSALDNRDNYPCFFIAPQSTAQWTTATDTVNVRNMIQNFETAYPNSLDTNRIYLTGLSEGGIGTYNMSINLSALSYANGGFGYNVFAALVPQSGKIDTSLVTDPNDAIPNIPIWAFHGVEDGTIQIQFTDDLLIPYLRDTRGFSVLYTRYNTGSHGIWQTAYSHPLLLPWMMAQRLGQPRQGFPDITINSGTQGTSVGLSGTATNSPLTSTYNFTRVGWTSSTVGGNYQGISATGNGKGPPYALTAASAAFTASQVGTQRFTGAAGGNSYYGTWYYNITNFISSTVIDLDMPVTYNQSYIYTLFPGAENNPYPASTMTPTWSVSNIPLSSGTANNIQMVGEFPNNGYGGTTTINVPYLIPTYSTPTGDTTPPTLTITSPTGNTSYSSSVTPLALGGTASDNVGVATMTCSVNGTAITNPSLVSGNWTLPGGVALNSGPNTITVTAKDAKGNTSTRTLNVTYTPSSYSTWKTTEFGSNASNPAIAGDTADPDHDGIPNLLEYALGGDPNTDSLSILPVVSMSGSNLQISFTRIAPTDVTYIVQASSDLTNWTTLATLASGTTSWTGSATVNETGSGSTRNVTVQDTVAINSTTERYLRLKVTNP